MFADIATGQGHFHQAIQCCSCTGCLTIDCLWEFKVVVGELYVVSEFVRVNI
jgi:hypothetical protein